MPCLFGGEPVPVGGARPFEQPREEAEFHNCPCHILLIA